MARKGEDLGVSIYGLWRAGNEKLIPISGQYRDMGRALQAVPQMHTVLLRHDDLAVAPARSMTSRAYMAAEGAVGLSGPVAGPLEEMRQILADIFVSTANNLEDTGHALILAADRYSETDEAARIKYEKERENYAEQRAHEGLS
ncbi:hypothetical protein [Kineosporia babensis]|uniref:Uncharacterized protein n=1 Tax=Kineosporia babensis TaxID=499548 RepID=A0A9X1NDM2_9ACTN|nr:hypothetical protein [Kineosporia babensis]MCD5311869.1 hypothetical protein [Kineosporia babensis]